MRQTIPRTYATRSAHRRTELDSAVEAICEAWADLDDVDAIYAFGSYGRGTVGPMSDLDLLVVRRTTLRRGLRDLDLRSRYDGRVPIDLLVVTPEEFDQMLPSTSFGRTVLRELRRLGAS